ncbi:MAG: M23 family metallopeptidase [Patescibacteria group bacterium]|nr:M23 family metallopeptidase [Patescibacteria group bacterium]
MSFKQLLTSSALFSVFFTSTLLNTPFVVNAGVFSFVSDLLVGKEENIRSLNNYNSQNMALLKAVVSFNPNPSIGGGGTTIDGSALVSESGPTGTMANISERSNSDRIATYIVRKGDTLGQIADMFSVTVGTIFWSNDIKQGDLIKEGQVLSILPISGIKYTIKKGDTLASVVKKYQGDLKETQQYNALSDDYVLAVGDEIVIPGGEAPLPKVNKGSTTYYNPIRGAGGPEYAGYYIRPISGGRISQGLHGYNAIDFASSFGTPILAAASGKVIISKDNGYWNGGYGNYIVIEHGNGTQTLYSHNSRNIVWAGYNVIQGQVIGYIGSTGRSTGPHVHFEVRGAKNPFAK